MVVSIEPILKEWVEIDKTKAGYVQLILYGLLLVVLMRLRPQGALPEGFSVWRWLRGERRGQARRDDRGLGAAGAGRRAPAGRRPERGGRGRRERAVERRWHDAPVVLHTLGLSKRFGGIVAAEDLEIELRRGTTTACWWGF